MPKNAYFKYAAHFGVENLNAVFSMSLHHKKISRRGEIVNLFHLCIICLDLSLLHLWIIIPPFLPACCLQVGRKVDEACYAGWGAVVTIIIRILTKIIDSAGRILVNGEWWWWWCWHNDNTRHTIHRLTNYFLYKNSLFIECCWHVGWPMKMNLLRENNKSESKSTWTMDMFNNKIIPL